MEDNWISVEDRLPEYGERVIVFGEAKAASPAMGGAYPFITTRINLFGTSAEKEMSRRLDVNHFNAQYVTHWQPLPSPPQTIK